MQVLPLNPLARYLSLAAGALLFFPFHTASQDLSSTAIPSASAPRIQARVDDSIRIALPGNVRPEANPANDLGPVDDALPLEHMQLLLARSPRQQHDLETKLAGLTNKNSPDFHNWLTAADFGSRFGVDDEDIEAIRQWLESHGLIVNAVYPNRMMVDFSGSAGQVRSAFHTQIHAYEVAGQRHIANSGDPRIPAALAPVVAGIVSLHDFTPHPQFAQLAGHATPISAKASNRPVAPPDLAVMYNLAPAFKAGYTGKGQTIVVIEDSNVYATTDWTAFRSAFSLSSYTSGSLTEVHPAPAKGTSNCINPGALPGLDVEPILDAEYATAAAPGAAIELASCASTTTTFGGLIALQNLLNASSAPPALVSISFGECEALNGATANAAYNAAYEQAAAEGVSVFVAAGDSGGAFCDLGQAAALHGLSVNAYASTPYNVAVGGTDLSDTYLGDQSSYWNASTGVAASYVPEIPWNDSCANTLLASYEGDDTPYGSSGFCNTKTGSSYQTTTAASGGPSGCASGAPSASGVTGGTCKGYAKPGWQTLLGNPKDSVRDLPDVSLFAGDGLWLHYYLFCNSDVLDFALGQGALCSKPVSEWALGGGTSFASPIMAGIQALVNQKWGRQGNPNPIYYKIAAAEYGTAGTSTCSAAKGSAIASSCIFNDVTQGNSDVNCEGADNCYLPSGVMGVLTTTKGADDPAYSATTGWDFATGIGSVNAYNLLMSTDW